MTDVVILALNSNYVHSALAPRYLKAAIGDLPLLCEIAEHTVNESVYAVAEDIAKRAPRLLAVSVYIWNIQTVYKLATLIKEKLPNVILVLGGPEVSYNAVDVLKHAPEIDCVICGEGEIPFRLLCDRLISGNISPISGIAYRRDGRIVAAEPFVGSGTPVSPYTDEYLATLKDRIAYFESSRGCPYACAYCLSGRCDGLRFFDNGYVYKNLIRLAASGAKVIKFVDRTFNADRKRAYRLFSYLIHECGKTFPSDVCFHFELSGDLLDDETIALLCSAPRGLFQFEIGIQSFHPETIRAIRRATNSSVLKQRISQLTACGRAHIHVDLIAGLPYEDFAHFRDSFNQAYALGADMLQLGFLKILHGTELEARASAYGLCYTDAPPYEVTETPWLSALEIGRLKTAERAVDRLHNSGRFRRTLALCIPFWTSPFDFFLAVGQCFAKSEGLDALTNRLFDFLCRALPEQAEEIRDALVCDRLATNSSRGLPHALYRPDSNLGVIRARLNRAAETAEHPGVRRNIAILYNSDRAVFADYSADRFDGREYILSFVSLSGGELL